MTRTHPPDILVSTLYQDNTLNPITGHSISLNSTQQCDLQMIDKPEIINKRHCRSFDFIESLDDPQSFSSSMEYPYKRTEYQTLSKDRTRSKSAPRVKSSLTPVPISVSPPGARKAKDTPQATSDTLRTSETHRDSYSSNRAYLNEVHPIKLQPHSPLYVSDCFEEDKQDKPAITPHVRCRVDIKPDAAVLQHTTRPVSNVRTENPWQRYSQSSSSRGLYVPRQIVSSPTPTPSECYSGDFRQGYHYTTSMSPISYQHLDMHRMQRAYSNPNIPTKFFYTEDPVRYPVHPYSRTYFQDDQSRSYFSQTPLSRPYYGEDHRANPYYMNSSRVFYSKSFSSPAEQYIPSRTYYTEGRRRPHMSQAFTDDWYRSSISGYSNQSSVHTPPRTRQDPSMSAWFANSNVETSRLGSEVKNHSKSWDNILYPRHDREQSVPRGRSYENLFYQGRHTTSSDVAAQPVILNLSSSPRRYAALSVSESSLERSPSNPWRTTKSGLWFVTPEITITDNDIRAIEMTKDRKHNNFSLQQSLEQLDELLADLVVDYKPPTSRKSSEGLLDQLKQLISEDDKKEIESPGLENSGCLNTQLPSTKSSPDTVKDPDSGCDGLQRSAEECSPDHSTDEDDTMVCANKKCNRIETLFNACLYFKSCHSCYTFYCSRNCRRDDWENHKENCLYGRVSSVCRHTLKFCRENSEIHKAFSRIAKAGYLSRGRGVLFLGFANPGTADNFLQVGLESLLMSPTYLSLRELDGFKDNLGDYCKELQQAGNEYDPNECFLLNVSIAVGELVPNRPSPRVQAPTVRKYAKVSLASSSPDKKVFRKDNEMETLILTPPPGTPDIDKEGEEGRKAREVCFVNIQRELRTRGVFLRHEYPKIYNQLCEFVESNKRFTPTTIYPIDKRTGKQFMCMIMAASEPRTLDWVGTPHLLDDII
uniref:Un-named hu7912 n=1 Tax=Myripristis murdjan TaxID=586833 RepID=A0A667X264_9TELE